MALQRGKLADIQYIANAAASIYANPAASKTYIRGFIIFNGNTSAEVVKIYNVPDNSLALGTAGAANQFFEVSLSAKATFFIDLKYPIVLTAENDSIQAVTTTASKVTVQMNGDIDA